MKIVLEEIVTGHERGISSERNELGRYSCYFPDCCFIESAEVVKSGRSSCGMRERFEAFRVGHWVHLLAISVE